MKETSRSTPKISSAPYVNKKRKRVELNAEGLPMTNEQKEARKHLKKLIPSLYESPKKIHERQMRLLALFKTPLFTEDVEEQRETGRLLQKALAEPYLTKKKRKKVKK